MDFDKSESELSVPADIRQLFKLTWDELAHPGSGWDGPQKVAIASAVREARSANGPPGSTDLGEAADRAIDMLVIRPAEATEDWVGRTLDVLGVVKYVELVGWGSIVVAIDTFDQLMGGAPEPLPHPKPGSPQPVGRVPGLGTKHSWVPISGLPLPRNTTSAVPDTQRAVNRLIDRLYITPDQSREVESIRGMGPVHLELLVSAVSYQNRCFYCTLGHIGILMRTARQHGTLVESLGIADHGVETGVVGGSELVALARSAVTPNPDPGLLRDVAGVLGPEAAVTSAEIAAGFNMINRLVEMTGQPAMSRQRDRLMPVIEPLGLLEFPHSGVITERDKPGMIKRAVRKVRK